MSQHIKHLYGKKLGAKDGEIGHVKDLYFDDQNWAIRYVVADTGNWLTGRLVLLSPHAFGPLTPGADVLPVNLTRKQIEDCPPIEEHRPVSRQYEVDYFQYYGWPAYWEGGGMLGVGGIPVILPRPATRPGAPGAGEDQHLRSTQALKGYHIQAADGAVGRVTGFLIDEAAWKIADLVIETGHWYAGREIRISPARISRISHEDSYVFVQLTKADILRTAEDHRVQSSE